jgi:hypothetical protein
MDRFLSQCAKYIINKHSSELHDICIVFPNRRAGVFFISYLQKELSGTVIAPCITQVNELFQEHSDLWPGERLQLISHLYKIFREHTETSESFDDFYYWGEVLLSDFNDIDSYLIEAEDIFTNVSDLKEIDSLFYYLTPEQKEAIARFWGCMVGTEKRLNQKNFTELWNKLYPVYRDYKKFLYKKGLAYSGMIYREVVEKLGKRDFQFRYKKYYFAGLNALNSCEKALFEYLKQNDKAEFLWDYHPLYLNDNSNEAGKFIRENLNKFPPPEDFNFSFDSFGGPGVIKIVSVSSNYGQAQQIPRFIEDIHYGKDENFDSTAVIIADESLLFPALGALPADIKTVNVTMGYPVKNSVVFGFLILLVNLLKNRKVKNNSQAVAYYRYVTNILNHQLLENIESDNKNKFLKRIRNDNTLEINLSEIDFSHVHKLIFSLPEKVGEFSSYFLDVLASLYNQVTNAETGNQLIKEMLYSLYVALGKLKILVYNVCIEQGSEITENIYFRLFEQFLGHLSVPFEGEPLKGIQVMGILETRCLDFSNIIVLGFNENKWPDTNMAPSFIPYNIRKGFNMPGIDEQDAMYAYYFYRLMSRAENITLTYSTLKDGISTGELSRYGYQLLYDSNFIVKTQNLDYSFANEPLLPVTVPNKSLYTEQFLENNSQLKPLSPTAINTFLHCTLQFYFRYILKLPDPQEMKDEIDSPVFGNIFHQTIESLYKPFVGQRVKESDLKNILNDKNLIEMEILDAVGKHYLKGVTSSGKTIEPRGKSILIFENIKIFLKRLISIDMQLTPFDLLSLEKSYHTKINIETGNGPADLFIGGKIDRIDQVDGNIRILDYKTGYVDSLSFNTVDELFVKENEKPKKEILQALLYSYILKNNMGSQYSYNPVIYSLRRLFNDTFSPGIMYGKENVNIQEIEVEFISKLKEVVSEIFSSDLKFSQTTDVKYCRYCAYNKICMRY